MKSSPNESTEIKQYLLGVLSPEAQERVEQRLMTEEAFLEELSFGEDELIDLYLNHDLSNEDRAHFESHFLNAPERQQKLRFARTLSRYIARKAEESAGQIVETQPSPPVPSPTKLNWAERFRAFWNLRGWIARTAMALVIIAIVAGAFWLSRLRTQSPQTFASLTLTISASTRAEGAQASKVTFPLKTDALRISLKLPATTTPAARYRVELVNDNQETKTLELAGQDNESISVVIPAAELARGQYALKLFKTSADGVEQRVSGSYFFTVE